MIRAQSPLYSTPAFPPGSGPDFVNAAVSVETDAAPDDILRQLHLIEASLGRRRTKRWAQRTIDLDLIALEETLLPDPAAHRYWRELPLARQVEETPDQLVLPHPRMQDRAFVLVPLADVAPDWVHPALGRTVRQMCEALPDATKQEVRALQ